MLAKIRENIYVIFFLVFIMAVLGVMVLYPPVQSPDEHDHLSRAYSLKEGNIISSTVQEKTGGEIDSGFAKYIKFYEYMHGWTRKFERGNYLWAREIRFSKDNVFVGYANTSLYFPFCYLPQAIAIVIGEMFDFRVNTTYYLTRIFSFLAVLGLLMLSFKYYPPNFFILSLLFLPICLGQFASASADGIQFALVVFIMSLFCHEWNSEKLSGKSLYMMALALLLTVTNRMNMIGFILLPLLLGIKFKDKRGLWTTLSVGAMVVAWILIVMFTVKVVSEYERLASMPNIVLFYLTHPIDVLVILKNTWTDSYLLSLYKRTFVSGLGYHSAVISFWAENVILVLLGILLAMNVELKKPKGIALFFWIMAGVMFVLTFLLLLVEYTNFPGAKVVIGVQGRYFIPIAIMLGYGVVNNDVSKLKWYVGFFLFVIFALLSYTETLYALLTRYWY